MEFGALYLTQLGFSRADGTVSLVHDALRWLLYQHTHPDRHDDPSVSNPITGLTNEVEVMQHDEHRAQTALAALVKAGLLLMCLAPECCLTREGLLTAKLLPAWEPTTSLASDHGVARRAGP